MSFEFIDISSNNAHPIDWAVVKMTGIKGVMIKCTEGTSYVNPCLKQDVAGARAFNLHVGYYHFARPSQSDGATQAAFAAKTISGLPRDMGLALDLEVTEGMGWSPLATWAENFLAYLSGQNIGSPIYLNENFLDHLPGAPFKHKLWLAAPGINHPRRAVWAWQYTGLAHPGNVPGIKGPVDRDVFYG